MNADLNNPAGPFGIHPTTQEAIDHIFQKRCEESNLYVQVMKDYETGPAGEQKPVPVLLCGKTDFHCAHRDKTRCTYWKPELFAMTYPNRKQVFLTREGCKPIKYTGIVLADTKKEISDL